MSKISLSGAFAYKAALSELEIWGSQQSRLGLFVVAYPAQDSHWVAQLPLPQLEIWGSQQMWLWSPCFLLVFLAVPVWGLLDGIVSYQYQSYLIYLNQSTRKQGAATAEENLGFISNLINLHSGKELPLLRRTSVSGHVGPYGHAATGLVGTQKGKQLAGNKAFAPKGNKVYLSRTIAYALPLDYGCPLPW